MPTRDMLRERTSEDVESAFGRRDAPPFMGGSVLLAFSIEGE